MLTLLAGRIKEVKAMEGSPTATSSRDYLRNQHLCDRQCLNASGMWASALAGPEKSPPAVGTDKEKKKEPAKAQEKPKGTAGGKEKGEPKWDSDRPGHEFTAMGPKKRQRVDSLGPHEQPKKQPKARLSLVANPSQAWGGVAGPGRGKGASLAEGSIQETGGVRWAQDIVGEW
jgi:hypothetical protein